MTLKKLNSIFLIIKFQNNLDRKTKSTVQYVAPSRVE